MSDTTQVALFGFSVSEQKTGYVARLGQLAATAGRYSLVGSALGGASAPILPYIFDYIPKGSARYIVLEIATSLRFAESDPKRYHAVLHEIAVLCRKADLFPVFVNMYRINVNYKEDQLSRSIEEFSAHYGFPCLSLEPQMVAALEARELEKYLRDGTHTTELGAETYASAVHEFILRVLHDSPYWNPAHDGLSLVAGEQKTLLTALPKPYGARSYQRSNLEFPVTLLPENSTLAIDLPENVVFDGLFFIMGPRTGRFELTFDTGKPTGILAYDKTGYYERFSYKLRRMEGVRHLIVKQIAGRPDISLRKGVPNDEPRIGQICGVLASTRRSI